MLCPKCGFDSPSETECLRCGVVFAKLVARSHASQPQERAPEPLPELFPHPVGETEAEPLPPLPAPTDPEMRDRVDAVEGTLYTPEPVPEPDAGPRPAGRGARPADSGALTPEAKRALVTGFGLAVLVIAVPFLRFALSYIGVLVHELGHSAVSWLFGYPAIPALDFSYGGGVSLTFGRRPMLVVAFVLCLVLAVGAAWRHPRLRLLAGMLVGLWILASVTALHEVVILAMGHAAELMFAALCLHRAITGEGTERRIERPLYAMVGWFLILEGTWFAWGLLTDPGRRQAYEDAKGGGHWMDFSRLAEDYFGVDLSVVAVLFLLACLATPVLVWVAHRHRERWRLALERWLGGGARASSGRTAGP